MDHGKSEGRPQIKNVKFWDPKSPEKGSCPFGFVLSTLGNVVENLEFYGAMCAACFSFVWVCTMFSRRIINFGVNLPSPSFPSINGHFPGEPGLTSVYWSKGWWRWWWQLDYWSYKLCKAPVKSSPPTNQHPVFLQVGCPSCRPTNSVKALKGKISHSMDLLTPLYI